jgi:hypothetical protein
VCGSLRGVRERGECSRCGVASLRGESDGGATEPCVSSGVDRLSSARGRVGVGAEGSSTFGHGARSVDTARASSLFARLVISSRDTRSAAAGLVLACRT